MRKFGLLLTVATGWAAWRGRRSLGALVSLRGVGPGSSGRPASQPVLTEERMEKVRALVELGRERGRDLLQQALGGRNAA